MKKQSNQMVIVVILAVILVIAWIYVFDTIKKRRTSARASPAVKLQQQSQPTTMTVTPSVKKQADTQEFSWVRCPFSGKRYGQEPMIDLKISGIIWDEIKPQVIINDMILTEGAAFGSYVIKRIEKKKVVISDGSKDYELTL